MEGKPAEAQHHAAHQHEAHNQKGDGVGGATQRLFDRFDTATQGLQQGWKGAERHGGIEEVQWLPEMRFCSQVIRRSRIRPIAPIQITPSTISDT